jgi:peroxiredoxin
VELQRALPDFERNGIAVFAISYDAAEVLARFSAKHGITYPLLSDEGSRVITALGMLNERVYEHHAFYGIARQDHHWGVPYPGTFVLDAQGVVTQKRFQSSYRMRETGVGVLEQAFGLTSTTHGPEARAMAPGVAIRAYLDAEVYRIFQRLRLAVELEIEPGLHVYGRPIPEGFIPLGVEVEPVQGLIVGPLEGPAPRPFRVEGLDESFMVYEGRAAFSRTLAFTENVGDVVVRVAVGTQVCSDTDCLPPHTSQLELPLLYRTNVDSDR